MPQAAAHILIPLILASLVRDFYIKRKDKKKFPLHYVLIIGLAGIIPDLDVLAFWLLHFFGFSFNEIHRTVAHTIFIPIIFVIFGLLVHNNNIRRLGKHKLRLNLVFYCLAIGSFAHLILDAIFSGYIVPLYPLSNLTLGLNLFGYLPIVLERLAAPCLDAGLLIVYLFYLEIKHKISDFI